MDANGQTSELVGSVLGGRYRIVRRMGAGGMGAVYEALQEDLNRRVAVKVLHPHLALDADLVQRFKREAQAAAALGHPNIVHVTDFQVNPGEQPFLVMEYLTGKSFRELMKEETRLPAKRAAFIATQVLSALAAAHEANIVHRDIKPDNIFLSSTSAMKDLVKVLDFGIAKLLKPSDEGPLTMAGTVLGTLSYMAPEQARGEVVDHRADLYALGCIMFEL
ncbi:MAG: serine/threonine-protein kinase, partial [Polyangiaceae bacterium]